MVNFVMNHSNALIRKFARLNMTWNTQTRSAVSQRFTGKHDLRMIHESLRSENEIHEGFMQLMRRIHEGFMRLMNRNVI